MNMAIAENVNGGCSVYFMGISMKALEDFFKGPDGKRFKSWERIPISDAKALGPGAENIEKAKEEIRSGKGNIVELGGANVIVFT